MRLLKIIIPFSMCVGLFFTSCKDQNEYRVDTTFAPYLLRFQDSAAVRGKIFDLSGNGLIMEFAKLKDGTAGLTHYEDPIRIEFDKAYWDGISNSAGADQMKEDLVFHELGHGLLMRKHVNDLLENGDWKSMMCGGDKVNERSWNINYKGIRRLYYINELFDQDTPAPDFSSLQLLVDTTRYIPQKKLNFNTTAKIDFGWEVVDNSQHKISLENGRLRFESKVTDVFLVLANTDINIQSDFSYELNLQYNNADLTGQYGIVFGNLPTSSTGTTAPLEYFSITNNKKMYMGNRTWYSYFTELTENQIVPSLSNHLKVFKIGKMLYYFINGVYCYCSEIETSVSGTQFGFIVPAKAVVLLDNFAISQRYGSGTTQQAKRYQLIEFKSIIIKSLNQGIIKK